MAIYESKAVPKKISATVRLSRSINYNTFVVEYSEERELSTENIDYDAERQLLLDDCTEYVNNQLYYILEQNTDLIAKK